MADSKISALPASTTPLAGTEVLPIVQSSATKQVSVANLTAGRAISATQLTLTTGNLIVASGQGIDFSATPNTGTSELFADYEEGTWTATLDGSTTSPTVPVTSTGKYTKMGRQVTVTFDLSGSTVGATGIVLVTGFPYAIGASSNYYSSLVITNLGTAAPSAFGAGGNSYFALVEQTTFNYIIISAGLGRGVSGTFTYFV